MERKKRQLGAKAAPQRVGWFHGRPGGDANVVQHPSHRENRLELLGQLTGGIAHDFNNLLTAIEGHLDLARVKAAANKELRNNLEVAIDCSRRAGTLSRRLLDFSRADFSEPKRVAVCPLVEQIAAFLRPLIRADIEIRIDELAQVDTVLVDAGQVEQAIMNLALNAQDAMPGGGVLEFRTFNYEVTDREVARHPWLRTGRFVRIEVEDSGEGIAERDLPHVFEPFYTSKPEELGTGLGLSIVYGIIKQHRGFIGVDSHVGNGTRFWILLPAVGGAPQREQSSGETETVSTPRPGSVATILVVEDEDVVRDLACLALENKGYQVYQACSAETAEALFEREADSIDLLLTDVVLSGSNGRQLADDLRSRKPELKVIYTSGYDMEHTLADVGRNTDWTFLEKPYSLKKLTQQVESLLSGVIRKT